ncbi:MAG: efflux RND transporter periplasmic adaptor subunit [Sporichthyaceae bacterium]
MNLFSTKKRRLAVVTLAVVAVGGCTGAWARSGGEPAAAAATSRTSLATASTSTVEETVSASGTVQPAEQDELAFPVSGTVTAVNVAVGDVVKRGQTLATIDTADLERAVEIADATYDAAQAQVAAAADNDAAANTDASAAQLSSAKAQRATAADRLAAARADLDGATLTAPFAGTVAAVGLAEGDRVGSGGGAGAGATSTGSTITLVGTKSWVVEAAVSGSDLDRIAKDQQARISLGGATQQIFGTVAAVGVVASSASGASSSFPVTIKVTGSPAGVHPGASSTVTIVTAAVPDVLSVPTNAIRQENNRTVVTKVVDGRESTVEVVVGVAYGPITEIQSGLVEGDQVKVTSTQVRPGMGAGAGNRGVGQRGQGTAAFQFPAGGALPQGMPMGGAFTGGAATFGGGTR